MSPTPDDPTNREQADTGVRETPVPAGDPAVGGAGAQGGTRSDRADRMTTARRRWRRELADLGGPNTLLWHKDSVDGDLELTTAHPGGVSMLMAGRATRLSDLVRERSAFLEACRRVELIRAKSIELEEERGLRTCFMAIGMAGWTMPGTDRRAAAPVLIRSCTLHPVNAAHTDYDIDLGDDLDLNPVLVNYLTSRGVQLNPAKLVGLAYSSQRFDPQPVFREITRLAHGLPELNVIDRKVISTFSPAKLPMIADLSEQGETLDDHEIIAALAGDPGARSYLRADAVPEAGADTPALRELLVVDADSRQKAAVEAVRSGLSIVVSGAPGTGRTQTVANMVAATVGADKRVLVVSNKRVALTDLRKRLAECELGDLVLDFPGGAQSPGAVSRAYAESLSLDAPGTEPEVDHIASTLDGARERLAGHREYLHGSRSPWGVSVFDALGARSRLRHRADPPASTVRLDAETLLGMDKAACDENGRILREAAAAGAWAGGADDPWAGARVVAPATVGSLGALVRDLAGKRFTNDAARLDQIFASVGLPPAPTPAHWGEAVSLLLGARRTLAVLTPEVYTADLDALVDATADRTYREERGVSLGWWTRGSLIRRAKELVREDAPQAGLHTTLAAARDQLRRWKALGGPGSPRVPEAIDEAERLWTGLANDLARLDEALTTSRAGADLTRVPTPELMARVRHLDAARDRLEVLPAVTPLLDTLATRGLRPLVDDLAARGVSGEDAAEEMEHVWWESILDHIGDEPGGTHAVTEALTEFQRLDRQYLRLGGHRVAARAATRMRQAKVMYADQAAYLTAQDRLPAHQVRPRELLGYTADALLAARPVWTMSPLVVASVVPPGQWFDLVIIEGAEQVATSAAITAISRAAQVAVVGDERGLPPTGFTLTAAEPRPADTVSLAEPVESVLGALTDVLPVHRLTWSYGGEDERVTAFANLHEYDGELVTFPGTSARRPMNLVTVTAPDETPGDADDPAARDLLRIETAKVVDLAIEHARTDSRRSLGVVTVSPRHSQAVQAELRRRLVDEADPVVLAFFEAQAHPAALPAGEPFFVKHLERTAGDTRDVVIFSVGSFSGEDGRALHRAGPLGLDGGEKRLGVVVTAARSHLTVVTALTASDLDGGRMTSRGAQALRNLIAYAESGADPEVLRRQWEAGRRSTNVTPLRSARRVDDDTILSEFALQLRKEGLVVHERYGTSAQPLDLAVEDPLSGRVVVAVESDGRRYAEVPSTRERERLRQEQFEAMGWEYVRVWSQSVEREPGADVSRVIEAIRTADARSGRVAGRAAGRRRSNARPDDLW